MTRILATALLASTLGIASGVTAQTVTIGEPDGAVFEGIIDGFPMIAPFDGEPDLSGNQLGVALKGGVTEERGVMEFPLAPLGDATADAIAAASLRFNIDDVLSTFGPGTDFAGRAAHRIVVYAYAADGTIQLADFKNVGGTPETVDTTGHGSITDTTLAATGPVFFEVDLTDAFREIMLAGASHVGIVWRTSDSPTGTSLDDLGDGSLGPPGAGGASLPVLSVLLADAPTASPSSTPTATPSPSEPPPTPTFTPQLTETPTAVPPTLAPTETPTNDLEEPTPTPGASCSGDCNGSDAITIDEIIMVVSIALGNAPLAECPAADGTSDGGVAIDDVLAAVKAALQGCGGTIGP